MPGLLFLWSFLSLLTEKAYNGLFKSIFFHRFHQSINLSSTGSSVEDVELAQTGIKIPAFRSIPGEGSIAL